MSRDRLRSVPAVAVAALLGSIAAGCGAPAPEAAPDLRPVRYQRVTSTPLSVQRSLAGVVRAGVESRLSFRVAGSVEQLDVKVGDRVRRGRVLARLDPTEFELRVEEAKAALAQAAASLRRAEADYERVRALYENNNASKAELDASRAGAESAQAQVEAVTKQLEQATQQLGYTSLRAPADGAIASVSVEVNENVRAGQEICLLIAGGRAEVVIPVPEVMIAALEPGQRVTVTIDALGEQSFAAEITEVGVAMTGAATTYPVTARLVEPNRSVRAGMAAEVELSLGGDTGEAIVVPGVAVGEDPEGRYVLVLEPGTDGTGTVRRRGVEIGAVRAGGIEVLAGLSEGELVVTAGVRRLSDGMRVAVPAAAESEG